MYWWLVFGMIILTSATPACDSGCRTLAEVQCSCACCWCACNVVEHLLLLLLLQSIVMAIVMCMIRVLCWWRRIQCRFVLFKLLEKIRWLEVFGHRIVHPRDNLVNRLFPWLLGIFATLNGSEKFAQCLLHNKAKILRYLQVMSTMRIKWNILLEQKIIEHTI